MVRGQPYDISFLNLATLYAPTVLIHVFNIWQFFIVINWILWLYYPFFSAIKQIFKFSRIQSLIYKMTILLQNEEGPDKFVFNAYNATTSRFVGKTMFNTDYEMFYNLTLDPETSQALCILNPLCGQNSSCAVTDCQVSMLKNILPLSFSIQQNKLECFFLPSISNLTEH